MGLLRFILTAILGLFALFAGLFAALVVAVTGFIAMIFRGAPRRPTTRRRPQTRRPQPRRERTVDTDVIDVDASEVKDR